MNLSLKRFPRFIYFIYLLKKTAGPSCSGIFIKWNYLGHVLMVYVFTINGLVAVRMSILSLTEKKLKILFFFSLGSADNNSIDFFLTVFPIIYVAYVFIYAFCFLMQLSVEFLVKADNAQKT